MNTVERLTDHFVPEHYDLTLKIDESDHTFSGTAEVKGTATHDRQPLKLHAKDLTVTGVTIDGQAATYQAGEYDELVISLDDLQAGEHTVTVHFNGSITDHMHGLYPCYYEHDGVKKELFATQFESHHAREVFPCIDEPTAKATFDLTLDTTAGVTSLSNMPVKEQKTEGDRMVTSFETSPRMSTYLLAFATGALQKKTAHTKDGVEVNVYATHAQPADTLDWSADVAVKGIEFYEDFYGVKYPLPKADLLALPDFESGAMENWGLITFRESTLLADPNNTSIDQRRYIAKVVLHELAHQWFGNLVTMKWWDDLWLNESFATVNEYISGNALYPDWEIWREFSSEEAIPALRRDAVEGVQSVQVGVNHPDEIHTLFDGAIVYAKGARLMRMAQHYIGDEAFQAGLKNYFAKYAYKNTVGDNLWDELSAASGKDIKSMMNTWISQPGYPIVTVTRDSDKITLRQEQFFVGPHEPSEKLWPIPLDASDNGAPQLMINREISWPSDSPIRLNRSDSAHFITHYDELSRQKLIEQVEDGTLDVVGRMQLLNESTMLVRGGSMSSDQLLPLIRAYKNETSEPVWGIVGTALGELRKFVDDDPVAEKKLRELHAWMASDQYARLGWEPKAGEPEEDTQLRSRIIGMTLYGEVSEAIEKAKNLYTATPLKDLDAELRPLVIATVAKFGDGQIVDDLMQQYTKTQSADLRMDIAVGVTATRVQDKITELLDNMKNRDIIKPQDVYRWFVYLVGGKESRAQAWQWSRDNWDWIDKNFGDTKSQDTFPRYTAGALKTRQQLAEYKSFYEPKMSMAGLTRTIAMGISEIEGRVALMERDQAAVVASLSQLDLR